LIWTVRGRSPKPPNSGAIGATEEDGIRGREDYRFLFKAENEKTHCGGGCAGLAGLPSGGARGVQMLYDSGAWQERTPALKKLFGGLEGTTPREPPQRPQRTETTVGTVNLRFCGGFWPGAGKPGRSRSLLAALVQRTPSGKNAVTVGPHTGPAPLSDITLYLFSNGATVGRAPWPTEENLPTLNALDRRKTKRGKRGGF